MGTGTCSPKTVVFRGGILFKPKYHCLVHVLISEEPVCKFLACLEQHALVRELLSSTSYWVCAYANNQHCIEEDIKSNPRSTSFYRAMQMSQGVLLVLDSAGTPFERIWCCFEESIAAALSWKGQIDKISNLRSHLFKLGELATDSAHDSHLIVCSNKLSKYGGA